MSYNSLCSKRCAFPSASPLLFLLILFGSLLSPKQIDAQASIGLAHTIPLPGLEPGTSTSRIWVTHLFKVVNNGDMPLDSILLQHEIAAVGNYGTHFTGQVKGGTISYQPAGQSFQIDPSYNGSGQPFLLIAREDDLIPVGDSLIVSIQVEVGLGALNDGDIIYSQASAEGFYGMGMPRSSTMDLSDSGYDAIGDNIDDALTTGLAQPSGGLMDPTPLIICKQCTFACIETLNASYGVDCERDVRDVYRSILPATSPLCVDLGYYTFQVRNQFNSLVSPLLTPLYFQDQTCYTVRIGTICDNTQYCQSQLCMKVDAKPFIEGATYTVYCTDPIVTDPSRSPAKTAMLPCQGEVPATFVGDWVQQFDCVANMQDTAKIIYRQYAATSKSGVRGVQFDTIIVLRLPPLSASNVFCMEKDTIFCGDTSPGLVGPYIILPPVNGASDCDTVYLLNQDLSPIASNAVCGLSVKMDSLPFTSGGCEQVTQINVQVYQFCYGTDDPAGPCTLSPDASDVIISGGNGSPIYATCAFWLMRVDSTAPVVECRLDGFAMLDTIAGIPTATVQAGPACASTAMVLPPVWASDLCNEITLVKAMLDTIGVFPYVFDPGSGLYMVEDHLPLPYREEPYTIVIEAMDECLNVSRDTCAVLVRDQTAPIITVHSQTNVSISEKFNLIDASILDSNNIEDNCELDLILARRADWETTWPDFCDSLRIATTTAAGDTLWCKFLDEQLIESEFQTYYREVFEGFSSMMGNCTDLIIDAWNYDLCRFATVECKQSMDLATFNVAYADHYNVDNLDELAAIGGGWGPSIPIVCADACSTVAVEILALDSWCNWSTGWGDLLVEDDMVTVMNELSSDIAISCTSFRQDASFELPDVVGAVTLSTVVERAESGDSASLAVLDSVFGTYVKAWMSDAGPVDQNGDLISATFELFDRGICTCTTTQVPVTYYDPDMHDFITVPDSVINDCYSTTESSMWQQGIVMVNCTDNTFCTQTVSSAYDDCGLGTITREFKIWKSCGLKEADTLEFSQTINLVNTCDLSSDLFDLPPDTLIYACLPQLNAAGQAIGADPDLTGRPVYKFNDGCRVVGVAYQDNVSSELTDDECYIIYRNWYFADWCENDSMMVDWYNDINVDKDTFVQLIILLDSMPPTCNIDIAGQEADTIRTNTCGEPLQVTLDFADNCSLSSYTYQLDTLGASAITVVGPIDSTISGTNDMDVINLTTIDSGYYRLMVRVTDHCNNESYCVDTVRILCDASRSRTRTSAATWNDLKTSDHKVSDMETPSDEIRWSDNRFGQVEQAEILLYQNQPNPFVNHTQIGFYLPQSEYVHLSIFDLQGRRIKEWYGQYDQGQHFIEVDGSDLAAKGLLFYRMMTSGYTATRKMMLVTR